MLDMLRLHRVVELLVLLGGGGEGYFLKHYAMDDVNGTRCCVIIKIIKV